MKWFQQRLKELKVSILFLTRLPAGAVKGNIPKIADIIWTFPIVGFLVGLIIGLSCFGLQWAGLSPVLSSILAVFIGILITGALHEDGLADSADGFGGGQGTLNKLEIMRDSRIGSYGVLALILTLAARVFALSDLPITYQSIILIICIAMVSRLAMACYLFWLPPCAGRRFGTSSWCHEPYIYFSRSSFLFANNYTFWQRNFMGFNWNFVCSLQLRDISQNASWRSNWRCLWSWASFI